MLTFISSQSYMNPLMKISWLKKIDSTLIKDEDVFIQETWSQFLKDVSSCGFSINVPKPQNVLQCYDFTFDFLASLDNAKLRQLLYRVDVPEPLIHFQNLTSENQETLTNLILQREAMKVFFRKHYKV